MTLVSMSESSTKFLDHALFVLDRLDDDNLVIDLLDVVCSLRHCPGHGFLLCRFHRTGQHDVLFVDIGVYGNYVGPHLVDHIGGNLGLDLQVLGDVAEIPVLGRRFDGALDGR